MFWAERRRASGSIMTAAWSLVCSLVGKLIRVLCMVSFRHIHSRGGIRSEGTNNENKRDMLFEIQLFAACENTSASHAVIRTLFLWLYNCFPSEFLVLQKWSDRQYAKTFWRRSVRPSARSRVQKRNLEYRPVVNQTQNKSTSQKRQPHSSNHYSLHSFQSSKSKNKYTQRCTKKQKSVVSNKP